MDGTAGAADVGAAVWLSFLLAGVIATLQGYAVARLGARYPSSGGIVTFLLQGFGPGHITAITSWLLYFASIIVTAMVAVSFGSYGSSLFFGDEAAPVWGYVLTTAVVLLVAVQYAQALLEIAGVRRARGEIESAHATVAEARALISQLVEPGDRPRAVCVGQHYQEPHPGRLSQAGGHHPQRGGRPRPRARPAPLIDAYLATGHLGAGGK